MIPFKKLVLTEDEKKAVRDVLDSGMIGLGGKVYEFEKALAEYVGSKEVVAVDSCTSAIFLSLMWEKMKSGVTSPSVGIPSMTVPLVAAAAREAGYGIVFDQRTDWVGTKYRLFGTEIIDSAHELERDCFTNDKKTFGLTDQKVCFSFYPTKNIGSADGGAIATDNAEFAKWARQIATYGRNQGQKYGNSWDYEVTMIGYKRHYTNLQAVLCLGQLNRLDETNDRRKSIRDRYNEAFGYKNTSLYLYRLKVDKRDEFINWMKGHDVECGVHFKPLHMMQAYQNFGENNLQMVEVERQYEMTASLPFFDTMTDAEVSKVIETVKASPFRILNPNA